MRESAEVAKIGYKLKRYEYLLGGAISATVSIAARGLDFQCISVFAAVWLLLIIAITDIRYMIIPDRWVVLLGLVAIGSVISGPETEEIDLMQHLIGMFIISGPMLIINISAGECFGGGDIKLISVCGLLLGWKSLVFCMILSFMTAGIFAAALLIIKRKNRKQYFAFGPFISAAVIADILWPDMRSWASAFL